MAGVPAVVLEGPAGAALDGDDRPYRTQCEGNVKYWFYELRAE
jgi:hypothetical protein